VSSAREEFAAAAPPRRGPRPRLLVRVPNWLGDLLMAEPVLRAADEAGGATLVGDPRILGVFDGALANCERLYSDDPRLWRGHDAALLLTGSFRTALTALRAGIPLRAGQARDARGLLLTHSLAPARERGRTPLGLGVHGRGRRWLPRPFGSVCVELAALVGLAVRERRPRLMPDWAASEHVRRRLEAVGIAPGSNFMVANVGSRPGSAKGAPTELWSSMLAALALRTDLPCVLVSGPGEEALEAQIHAAAPRRNSRAVSLPQPALGLCELAALFSQARVVVTADNGPRHLAVAVGTPVVAILGPTDPRHTADHLEHTRLVRSPVPCGPCHLEVCPLSGPAHKSCFTRIDPDEVVRAVLELAHAL
jgi:heptosyltransferase-2